MLARKKTDLVQVVSTLTSLGFQYLLETQALVTVRFMQARNTYLPFFGN